MRKKIFQGVDIDEVIELGGQDWDDVMVGIGINVKGKKEVYGEKIKKGEEEEIKEVKDEGGINGEKIEIKIGDEV